MRRTVIACAIWACVLPMGSQAVVLGNQQSQELVQRGLALVTSGQLPQAREQFELAAKADPRASHPVGAMALLYYIVSDAGSLDDKQRQAARQAAAETARQALALDAQDPLAQEVARRLAGGGVRPKYTPAGNAMELVVAGEHLFSKKEYAAALHKYEQAIAADPGYADAWLFAGDCYFVQRQWEPAAEHFRKATQIEPLHEQAWRYLADALQEQQKWPELELALGSAIGAHPDQLSAWQRMEHFQASHGVPLVALKLRPKAAGSIDAATGQVRVNIQPKPPGGEAEASIIDDAFWMALALGQANAAVAVQRGDKTAFQADLDAWNGAFLALDKMEAAKPDRLRDTAVTTLRSLAAKGALEPALLLLQYKEAYRPSLEAWKTAHPGGVRKFINTWHLMP
eukprot:gene19296-23107_t